MKLLLATTIAFMPLISTHPALGNGEPTADLSNTGIIVPIDEQWVYLLDERLTITLPKSEDVTRFTERGFALVRAEYTLYNNESKPVAIHVGWPTSGYYHKLYEDHTLSKFAPAIKLDGKPVGYNFLYYDDLAEPYVKSWMARIDKHLESEPALKERVMAIRKEGAGQGQYWMETAGIGKLVTWMQKNGFNVGKKHDAEKLAYGLLGIKPTGYGLQYDKVFQGALKWLDPDYEAIDLYETLSNRWGYRAIFLDPSSGQLINIRSDMLNHNPSFGIFRFPITLEPQREHKLVVQYGQRLGIVGRGEPDPWFGMVYLMQPAQRWGRVEKISIEIRAPKGWQKIAIRPPVGKAAFEDGYDVYKITMDHRPYEDLYISAVP